jgi:hypothetical protein
MPIPRDPTLRKPIIAVGHVHIISIVNITIEDMNLEKIPYTGQRHTQTNFIDTNIPHMVSPLLRANEEILLGFIDAHSPNRSRDQRQALCVGGGSKSEILQKL